MGTVALDIDSVMSELPEGEDAGMPDGTRIGHVHLHVADLGAAESFYAGDLGLDVTVRSYPGALFLSRDGYHHHIGLNTWQGEGAPPPPPGSRGLEDFELLLPDGCRVRAWSTRRATACACWRAELRALREAGSRPARVECSVCTPGGNKVGTRQTGRPVPSASPPSRSSPASRRRQGRRRAAGPTSAIRAPTRRRGARASGARHHNGRPPGPRRCRGGRGPRRA